MAVRIFCPIIVACLRLQASAFAPSLPTRAFLSPRINTLHFQEGEDSGPPSVIFRSANNIKIGSDKNKEERIEKEKSRPIVKVRDETKSSDERKIVLPPTATSRKPSEKKKKASLFGKAKARLKALRPATKFRAGLAAVLVVGLSATKFAKGRSFVILAKWLSQRGFQGLSALGRTVAYGWAVLIAYPRLLDRRAKERKQKEREKSLEQRRQELYQLANEVSRLRQELSTIDAEIRAFRREIISLKAMARNAEGDAEDDKSIEEAIASEMAHLSQLRSDTQAALTAARQNWAEARSHSPPEAWPGSMPPNHVSSTSP